MSAQRVTFALLGFICLGHFCVDFMLGIWPVFKTIAGLDIAIAGFIAGGCVVFGEGLQVYFGMLCDRGYSRALLLGGISLATAACFFSYSDSFLVFLFLFAATCLGSAAFHPTAASILSGLKTQNRSIIMGCFTASGMLGLGISQLLFSWTYTSYDRATGVLALPSIVLAVACYFFFKGKVGAGSASAKSHSLSLFLRFLKIKELRALYLTMLGNQIALWSLVFLLPDFLKERNHATWVVFGGGHFFLMAGATLGPLFFGMLADKTSSKLAIVLASTLTTMGFYLLLMPLEMPQELALSVLFLLGCVLGSVPPLVWALGGQMVPQHRGVVSAFLMGFVWIFSESLGLGLSGFLATLFEENAATYALGAMGLVQLVSCAASTRIPKQVNELVIS